MTHILILKFIRILIKCVSYYMVNIHTRKELRVRFKLLAAALAAFPPFVPQCLMLLVIS